MVLTQKCNCCVHEEVCRKKDAYKTACKQVVHNIPTHIVDAMSVSVSCKHFQPKSATRNGG